MSAEIGPPAAGHLFAAQHLDFSNRIGLVVFSRYRAHMADPLTMREHSDDVPIVEPTMTLQLDEAQQLLDELYRIGLRPSVSSGDQAAELAAVRSHLSDIRALAGGLLQEDGVTLGWNQGGQP